MNIENFKNIVDKNEGYSSVIIRPAEIVFEERVRLQCFHCESYNLVRTCPPRTPNVDYEKIISEYKSGLIIHHYVNFKDDSKAAYTAARKDSSVELHKFMLDLEKTAWENNFSMAQSFIGGSCKLCDFCRINEEGRCRLPRLSRIPMEGIGINVVSTAAKFNMEIVFPPKHRMNRYGIFLLD